ncbi:MAG: GIN domain-containing protein [Chitinophagales bacterium]|jgi:phage shock protein PspC (stress-responsive transcriptional regulator)
MNKIIHINLGGYALTIDEDAYEYLQAYLERIRRRFSESEGRDEIIRDVETRLGELITQNIGTNSIVMLLQVESAIEVMGKPEDFGGEGGDSFESAATSRPSFGAVRTGKKLFRDEDQAVVSGLCAGLTTYFGLADPVWMRIAFVILTFISAGFWVPVYLLLWVIVPPVKTMGDRLEMKGEPVNIDNLAKEFEKGYERIAQQVKGSGITRRGPLSSTLSGCLSILGKLVVGFLILISILLVLTLGSSWVAMVLAFFTAKPFLLYISPLSSAWTYFGVISVFIVIGIPVIAISLWIARKVFRFSSPKWLSTGLSALWILSFISMISVAVGVVQQVNTKADVMKSINLGEMTSDTLLIKIDQAISSEEGGTSINGVGPDGWFKLSADGERVVIRDLVRVRIHRSKSNQFECIQTSKGYGSNSAEARTRAGLVSDVARIEGNSLFVSKEITMDRASKWFGSNVDLNIYVPQGKYIVFDESTAGFSDAEVEYYDDDNHHNYISNSAGNVFKMTGKGLLCTDCPAFGESDYQSDRNYEEFIFEGKFEVELIKSENSDFSLVIEGDREALETIRSGDKLTLSAKEGIRPGTKVTIHTPELSYLLADDTGLITIRGFEEYEAFLSVKGQSRIKAYMDVRDELEVLVSGQGKVELYGEGGRLSATLSDNAALDANGWRANVIEVAASGNSTGRVYGKERAIIKTESTSTVKLEGPAKREGQQ